MKRGRTIAIGVVLALTLGAVMTAGSAGGAPAQATPSGTIRIAAEEELSVRRLDRKLRRRRRGGTGRSATKRSRRRSTSRRNGDYMPGAMLVDQPTLDPGPPMKVTYRIRPEAVWSDGQPITSADFEYTWKQIVDGKDIYDTTGYIDIAEHRHERPEDGGRHVHAALRRLARPVRWLLLRPPEPPARRGRTAARR